MIFGHIFVVFRQCGGKKVAALSVGDEVEVIASAQERVQHGLRIRRDCRSVREGGQRAHKYCKAN